MSLESADDLLGWLDVLVLDPDDPTSSTPVGRLADWERHADAHEWSEADRLAMREFVRFKALPSMARVMDTVRKGQAALLKSDPVAGALARAWPRASAADRARVGTTCARRVVAELAVLGIDAPGVTAGEQFLALIDQGVTDDELARAVVDWLADLCAEADARRMAEVPIARAGR